MHIFQFLVPLVGTRTQETQERTIPELKQLGKCVVITEFEWKQDSAMNENDENMPQPYQPITVTETNLLKWEHVDNKCGIISHYLISIHSCIISISHTFFLFVSVSVRFQTALYLYLLVLFSHVFVIRYGTQLRLVYSSEEWAKVTVMLNALLNSCDSNLIVLSAHTGKIQEFQLLHKLLPCVSLPHCAYVLLSEARVLHKLKYHSRQDFMHSCFSNLDIILQPKGTKMPPRLKDTTGDIASIDLVGVCGVGAEWPLWLLLIWHPVE